MVPFDDDPSTTTEIELRGQIGRLHAERRELLCLIEQQRIEGAKKDTEIDRLRQQLTHLRRPQPRRWWWR
jgi:hypothetical protein